MTRELIEAAKAVCNSYDSRYERICLWETLHERLATLRAAVRAAEAAPVADTVAVPVAAILRLKSTVSSFGVGIPDWARRARKAADDITKLLPPPPAPEPSVPGDVIDQWNREAVDYANEQFPEPPEVNRAARYGYVAARRAEWAKKGGG